MGSRRSPDDAGSASVGSSVPRDEFLHHSVFNMTDILPGDNSTLDVNENRRDFQESFDTTEINLSATPHSLDSDNNSLAIFDVTTRFHKTDRHQASFYISENYFEDVNQTVNFADQSDSTKHNRFFANYENVTENHHLQRTSYNVTIMNSTELIEISSYSLEQTTPSLINLTSTLHFESIQDSPFEKIDNTSISNIPVELSVFPVNISNSFQMSPEFSVVESLLNVDSEFSSPCWLNSSLVCNSSNSSGNPTSFTFDLTSWLTLTPSNTADDWFDASGHTADETTLVLKVILLAFISLVGCLGNILVIWNVVKERRLHRPPFYFLLSLGVTDLSRAVFCVPVVITTVLHGSRWRHGDSACKLFAFATSFFVFSSVLSLLAIAIDRHFCVVYSKIYRRRAPGIANLVVAIIIWIIAFSISFPPVLGVGEYVFVPEETQCTYHHKHYSINDSVSTVMIFVAILLVTYFFYFRIFCFLRDHRRMRPLQHTPAMSSNWAFIGQGANGQAFINWLNGFGGQVPIRQGGQRSVQRLNFGRVVNLSITKNEHLTRLFLILTVVFGISWLPYIIVSVWRIFFDTRILPSAFVTTSAWLAHGQVALCPVVYFTASGSKKKHARTVYSQAEKSSFLLENKARK